ncbi:hypothetical protein AB0B31_33370 [Catellatospora citrea]|uniref:hypothetical protein n=1 Tax=Catellatospora citrea TaxID=53366 RepID=UPI0033D9B42B
MAEFEFLHTPGELVERYGAMLLGFEVEWPIIEDYLEVTGGALEFHPKRGYRSDWSDELSRRSYIEILVEWLGISESRLQADARVKGRLRWPDILTFKGARVPPAVVNGVAKRDRFEFYDIKPCSDTGRIAGDEKIADCGKTYASYKMPFKPGTVYPDRNPKILKLRWSRAFEAVLRIGMARNGLKTARVELEVSREKPGILLYRFKFTFESYSAKKLTRQMAEKLAEGLMMALMGCAAEEALELGLGVAVAAVGTAAAAGSAALGTATTVAEAASEAAAAARAAGEAAAEAARAAKAAAEYAAETARAARAAAEAFLDRMPESSIPHVRVDVPDGLPELLELSGSFEDAMISRGQGIPGEEYLVCCDEAYFQNVVLDRRFAAQAAELLKVQGYQQWKTYSAYAAGRAAWKALPDRIEKVGWLFDQHRDLFPAQAAIVDVLRRLVGADPSQKVCVTNVVLVANAALVGYAAPELIRNTFVRQPRGGRHPEEQNGMFAMPERLLSKKTGGANAAGAGARSGQPTRADILKRLLTVPVEPSRVRQLNDALGDVAQLRRGLLTGTGFTLATAVHGIYRAGLPTRPDDRDFAKPLVLEASRLFAVPAGGRSSGLNKLDRIDVATHLAGTPGTTPVLCRYLGRLRVS